MSNIQKDTDPRTQLSKLSSFQVEEIKRLQEEGVVTTYDQKRLLTLRSLFRRGIVIRLHASSFELIDKWAVFDLNPKPAAPAVKVKPRHELEPDPDPPKKIKHVPGKYSNRSREELIDHVLKNY